MNNQKQQKPTLSGQCFQTRERDEQRGLAPPSSKAALFKAELKLLLICKQQQSFLMLLQQNLVTGDLQTRSDAPVAGGEGCAHTCVWSGHKKAEPTQAFAQVCKHQVPRGPGEGS